MSDTASAARAVIADMSGGADTSSDLSTTPSTELVAFGAPEIIESEVNDYLGESDSPTRRAAAVHTSRLDPRDWIRTAQGDYRREHTASSRTEQIAREMIDASAHFDGHTANPHDRRAIAIEREVAAFNAAFPDEAIALGSHPEGSPEWYQARDAALDKMIRDSRERRR